MRQVVGGGGGAGLWREREGGGFTRLSACFRERVLCPVLCCEIALPFFSVNYSQVVAVVTPYPKKLCLSRCLSPKVSLENGLPSFC